MTAPGGKLLIELSRAKPPQETATLLADTARRLPL